MKHISKSVLMFAVLALFSTVILSAPKAEAAWFTQECTVLQAGYNNMYGYFVKVQNSGNFVITKSFPADKSKEFLAVALTALAGGQKVWITFNNTTLNGGLVAELYLSSS